MPWRRLAKIDYRQLNARQKENHNFQKAAGLLADYGFTCIKLSDDWNGADFIAVHVDGRTVLRVQAKSRITINRRYQGKGLCVVFPCNDMWYLLPHDRLVQLVARHTRWLQTKSWTKRHGYSATGASKELCKVLNAYAIGSTNTHE